MASGAKERARQSLLRWRTWSRKWLARSGISSRRSRRGGHLQQHHVEPVVEILAEAAGGNGRFQVGVGGGDDAHVHRDGFGGAHGPHFAFLQHPQQLGLELQGHVADLVQEQGAAVGGLEEAGAVAIGAGEGALAVTEEFGFEHVLGNGGAVDRHEGTLGTVAGVVDGAGQQLIAGAALALDEHAHVAAGNAPRLLQELLHGAALADDRLAPAVVLRLFLAVDGAALDKGGLDAVQQLAAVEGLGEVTEHPLVRRFHGIGNGAVGGENDHRQRRVAGVHLFEQRHAIHLLHAQVGDQQLGLGRRQFHQRLAAVGGGLHLEAVGPQAQREQLDQTGVIVDQQDPSLSRWLEKGLQG